MPSNETTSSGVMPRKRWRCKRSSTIRRRMGSRLSLVRLVFQLVESNDSRSRDGDVSARWERGRISRSWSPSKGMKTNKNGLAAIRPMIMATNRNLRQWRRMKLGRAFVVTAWLGASSLDDIKNDGRDDEQWDERCNRVDASAEDENPKRQIPIEQ